MCKLLLLFSTDRTATNKLSGDFFRLLLRFGECTRFEWLSASFPEKRRMQEKSAQAGHLPVLSVLHKALFSSRDTIPFVLGEQLQRKYGWELIKVLLLPLCSLAILNTLQTLLTKDLILKFKSQAQGSVHFTGLWELGSTVWI